MLDKIYDIKADVLERLQKAVEERGLERMDIGEVADVVKDLSEAEYYCSVTDAMDSYGYTPETRNGMWEDDRRYGYRDSQGRYSTRANRRGYPRRMGHMDSVETIREELHSATPEERENLKQELRQLLGM